MQHQTLKILYGKRNAPQRWQRGTGRDEQLVIEPRPAAVVREGASN